VSNNTSVTDNGGAFYLSRGFATMYPGSLVTGNTAYGSGGGFFVNQNGTLTMLGGEISGNRANCSRLADSYSGYAGGGGVMLTVSSGSVGSKFIMQGGIVTGNYSNTIGGGVFVSGRTAGNTLILEGGTLMGNTCASANPNGMTLRSELP
jgi:hypothetical protein